MFAGVVFSCALVRAAAGQQPVPAPEQDASSRPYVLQRGDTLEIRVFNLSELDQTVTIAPDGKVSVLLLDAVDAAGLTTSKLDEMITARYTTFYRDPQVTVNVTSYANQKIFVTGEVQQPGLLPLAGELSAARAVIQAGGLRPSAKPSNVFLVRRSADGTPVATRVDLEAVFKGTAQDVPLMAFDVVYVPKSRIARIDQFMDQYVRQLVPFTLTAGFSYLLNNPLVVR
jgi:protein involved in polysaccharide export with SLBB domain